jgi:type IV pilus assembly protein PilM
MAKTTAVWGIDIGQSALKALRCRPGEDNRRIVADAFDYIEYPKILSQPDANPAELINEALKQFLSRNSVRGDKVVISVSGQSGLSRFIKLPPVESKKIPDIVKYEAKQQIPFPLEDVVWDYQQMAGGSTDDGFAMEAEVGLFAMKRDQVYKALKPYVDVDVEVDVVQLTPLALYNYVVFDQLQDLPPVDEYDPDNPPDSLVVLSLGTDTTDLVVTNGFKVWQRSIPIGGNHFTKALTKDLKMNFATAEHLKRNASQAEDPKALFQAMRPVFNDLLTEVQRSIGYFKNMDKRAKISRVVALGNVMRLPGLQRYLAQNLGFELQKVDAFRGLSGTGVVDAPAFKENMLAFGVCYGLTLQGLNVSQLRTNLLPGEIKQFRMIRAKKPYAVAAAALLLLGCGVSFFRTDWALKSVALDGSRDSFSQPYSEANAFIAEADGWQQAFNVAKTDFAKMDEVGQSMLQNVKNRDIWMKFLKAVNLCLPQKNGGDRSKEVAQRNEIKLDAFECRWVDKLEDWYATVKAPATGTTPDASAAAPVDPNAVPVDPNAVAQDPNAEPADPNAVAAPTGPTGPGWVFKITAHHYHNTDTQNQGIQYVRNTLLADLKKDEVDLPLTEREKGAPGKFPVKKMGIDYPEMIGAPLLKDYALVVEDEEAEAPAVPQPMGPGGQQGAPKTTKILKRLDFEVEFCWQPQQTKSDTIVAAKSDVAAQ